jgi:hypothetical protein
VRRLHALLGRSIQMRGWFESRTVSTVSRGRTACSQGRLRLTGHAMLVTTALAKRLSVGRQKTRQSQLVAFAQKVATVQLARSVCCHACLENSTLTRASEMTLDARTAQQASSEPGPLCQSLVMHRSVKPGSIAPVEQRLQRRTTPLRGTTQTPEPLVKRHAHLVSTATQRARRSALTARKVCTVQALAPRCLAAQIRQNAPRGSSALVGRMPRKTAQRARSTSLSICMR